jgi:hypothetical protein
MEQNNQSRVVFGGDEARPVFMSPQRKTSKMVQLVISISGGRIKDKVQAEKFLLFVVVVAIIIGVFAPSLLGPNHSGQTKLTPEMKRSIDQMAIPTTQK